MLAFVVVISSSIFVVVNMHVLKLVGKVVLVIMIMIIVVVGFRCTPEFCMFP